MNSGINICRDISMHYDTTISKWDTNMHSDTTINRWNNSMHSDTKAFSWDISNIHALCHTLTTGKTTNMHSHTIQILWDSYMLSSITTVRGGTQHTLCHHYHWM